MLNGMPVGRLSGGLLKIVRAIILNKVLSVLIFSSSFILYASYTQALYLFAASLHLFAAFLYVFAVSVAASVLKVFSHSVGEMPNCFLNAVLKALKEP